MENVEERVLDIRVRYDDAIRKIAEYRTQLDVLRKREQTLKEDLKAGRFEREEYNVKLTETQIAAREVNEVIRVLNKQVQNERKEQTELEGSLVRLRAELSNLTASYDRLSRAERNSARGKEIQDKINAITDELKEAEEGTQRFYRNVGNYEETLKRFVGINNDFANSLLNIAQNSNGVKGFFSNMKVEASALGSTLKALLKNPVFMSIAGVAGVGFAFKWWYDYNKGIKGATKLTKQFTDKSGDDLKIYRSEVQALADYYSKDFRDMLTAINSVEKQFGISSDEALKVIKDGFIAGADANGEFLSALKEYPAYFKEAGISADQFVAIVAETNKQGVFSDKGIDTIKEANTRLREMTTSTASALNGIGISSKQVQEDLQTGAKTTFQIMQEVSAKLDELPESSAVVGTAIADIFGGPGEDAGLQYIRTLKDISVNLDEVKGKTGELGKVEDDLLASQAELTKEVALLFDATGSSFEKMTAKVETFVNDVLSSLIKDVRTLFESVEDITERETKAAVELGKNVAEANVGDEYAKIEAARARYVKAGLSEEAALEKAKYDRLKVLKLTLNQEEEHFQKITDLNKKYNAELDYSNIWRRATRLTRSKSDIKKDIQDTWNEYINQMAVVQSQQQIFDLVYSYPGDTDKKKTPIVDPKAMAEALKIKKKELQEIRKAEDEMLKLIKDSREKQTQEIEYEYSRQIEDLKIRLETEKDLTPRAKDEIGKQILSLEQQKTIALQKLSDEELKKDIENRQKLIALQLDSVKAGSEQEYQLKMQQLVAQRDAELQQKELTEQMKLAIVEKYNKKIDDLSKQHENLRLESKKQFLELELFITKEGTDKKLQLTLDRLKLERDIELSNTKLTEEQRLLIIKKYQKLQEDIYKKNEEDKAAQIREDQQKEYLAAEKAGASLYQLQTLQAWQELDLLIKTNASAKDIATAKYNLFNTLLSQYIEATGELGETNKEFAKLSKTLALAQIAIETGRAISFGISQAMQEPFPANLLAVTTTIATIMTNIAKAQSIVKSAKFAQGGSVVGPGSGTSDSIPAMLSNGESVMTAAATSMFAPLLSAFNQMGGGIPINVTTSSNQATGEDMLAKAVARGMMMAPPPVLSVEEFTSVADRVKYVENLGSV